MLEKEYHSHFSILNDGISWGFVLGNPISPTFDFTVMHFPRVSSSVCETDKVEWLWWKPGFQAWSLIPHVHSHLGASPRTSTGTQLENPQPKTEFLNFRLGSLSVRVGKLFFSKGVKKKDFRLCRSVSVTAL